MRYSITNRIIALMLAVLMILPMFCSPIAALSVDANESQAEQTVQDVNSISEKELNITVDGEAIKELQIYEYEKVNIEATGITSDAEYQWQIYVPQDVNSWIDIYDAKDSKLGVSLALVGEVLDENRQAKLRCKANTETEAYITPEFTVTILENDSELVPTGGIKAKSEDAIMPLADEEVTIKIDYIKKDYELVENKFVLQELGMALESYSKVIAKGSDFADIVESPELDGFKPYIVDGEGNNADSEVVNINLTNVQVDTTYTVIYMPIEAEFVTVTINYERWENQYNSTNQKYELIHMGPAFSSYVATLPNGGELNTTVDNPTIVGFDPYLENGTEVIQSVPIDLKNIKKNVTITVNYKPKLVNYEVHYLFQNIYDDYYVEDANKSVVKQGETGLPPSDGIVDAQFDGFTALYYQPDTIAADGSTVFEVFYERNYYLLEIDCNEGYGANTIYVRHGTYISVPNPVRMGYLFSGWDLVETDEPGATVPEGGDGQKDELPDTMPTYNSMYKAIWTKAQTTYTIAYWAADLKGDGATTYSYFGSKKVSVPSATELTPSVVGNEYKIDASINAKEWQFFEYDENATKDKNTVNGVTDAKVIVEGDGSTVINVYYSRKKYEIRYIFARQQIGKDWSGNEYAFQIANNTGVGSLSGCTWENAGSNSPNIIGGYDIYEEELTTKGTKYKYFYIKVEAEYGAYIESQWPSAAIGKMNGKTFGSWAAEDGTGYRGKDKEHANIVGPYPYMSAEMINTSKYADTEPTVANGEKIYLAQRMVAWWDTSTNSTVSAHKYHIYYEVLPGESHDRTFEVEKTIKYFKLDRTEDFTCAHNGSTRVDPFFYTGFKCVNDTRVEGIGAGNDHQKNSQLYGKGNTTEYKGKKRYDCPTNSCAYCNCFYYERNSYTLTFFNYNNESAAPDPQSILYGESLNNYKPNENPSYPEGLEPGAYEFGGWYTTPQCYEGTEVVWNGTMDAADVTFYAKWTPIVRNVSFYLLYSDVEKGECWQPDSQNLIEYPIKVPHGELLGTTYSKIPQRGDYIFIGWFYFDENGKKKFAPDSMAVTRDLHLFAEWFSTEPTTYEVRYEVWQQDAENNTETYVADAAPLLEGYSTAGKTITFNAKGDKALYSGYTEGYFPDSASHSILMEEDSAKNTHTFKYYHKKYIQYKVVYKDRVSGKILGESEVKRTTHAIVTEKFKPFDGMIPEEYYIQRSIAYDSTKYEGDKVNYVAPENIIYFYYVPDTQHGPYRIEHYQKSLDGEYVLAQAEQGIYDKDKTLKAYPKIFDGYELSTEKNSTVTVYQKQGNAWAPTTQYYNSTSAKEGLSGTVTVGGLEIKFYYDRVAIPYEVQYVEFGTDNILFTGNDTEFFGKTVSHTAPATYDKSPYTYIYYEGADSTDVERTKSISLRTFENGKEDNPNVLTFYYSLKKIPVYYHVVCKDQNLGSLNSVSLGNESAATASGLAGSNALVGTGFKFIGWYFDEECTNKVSSDWVVDDTHLKPKKIEEDLDGKEHFYALFEPVYSSMKIVKSGVADADKNQYNFIFNIKGTAGTSTQNVDLMVLIQGNGEIIINELPIGEYKITEVTEWSWEYAPDEKTKKVEVSAEIMPTVSFVNKKTESNWLNGESMRNNKFNK